MREITPQFLEQITRHEGYRKSAYQDSEGYWTIGIGTLIDDRLNAGISKKEAQYLATNRLITAAEELKTLFHWYEHLSQTRKQALINMCFNMGIKRLQGFKKMLSAMEKGDYELAANEALNSKWAHQVKGRAVEIAKMIRNG